MAGEIFIAKESTSQEIKTNTESLLGKSFGTDFSGFTPIHDGIVVTNDATPSGQNRLIKEIVGSGYLSCAFLVPSTASVLNASQFQITIDGVVILRTGLTQTGQCFGLFDEKSMYFNGSATIYANPTTASTSFLPIVAGRQQFYGDLTSSASTIKNLMIQEPIFFKNSLKIEFVSASSATDKGFSVTIKGGFKV